MEAEAQRPRSGLDVLGELSARMQALEAQFAELKDALNAARDHGDTEPYEGFRAHVTHVMQKHFWGDKPEAGE